MTIGILALRATIGGFFLGHGCQKLFGVAGGHGLKGTGQFFESIGLRPGVANAALAGAGEAGGGIGLLLGYQTPMAASAIAASMLTAIQRVTGRNGWDIQNGGFEYGVVLLAGALSIVEHGPGPVSLDARAGRDRSGPAWAMRTLGAGVAGAVVAHVGAEYFGRAGAARDSGGAEGADGIRSGLSE